MFSLQQAAAYGVHLAQIQQVMHGSCDMDKLSFLWIAQLSIWISSAFSDLASVASQDSAQLFGLNDYFNNACKPLRAFRIVPRKNAQCASVPWQCVCRQCQCLFVQLVQIVARK
jgi:hypothetical protein